MTKKIIKKKPTRKSKAKQQAGLLKLSLESFGQLSSIVAIFLVRQGLKGRNEQITALAEDEETAVKFCRTTLMPQLCKKNEKESVATIGKDGEYLAVNKSNDLLLIKRIDFVRTEEGRTSANPVWYWNIAKMTIITKHGIK